MPFRKAPCSHRTNNPQPPSRTVPLQRLEELYEISFLCLGKAQREERIVVVDDGDKIGSSPVVKVWRVLPRAAQGRGSIHPRRAAGDIPDIRSNLRSRMQKWRVGTAS